MKSVENFISEASDYFVYMPSLTSQKMFFYPVCTGHFIYEPGYTLLRESYDSFFIIYIQKGMLHLKFNGKEETAVEGSFVFLDCYLPHSYDTDTGCEALDGITARPFYSAIVSRLGNVFSLMNPLPTVSKLNDIYHMFFNGNVIKEAILSKNINDILTSFLVYFPTTASEMTPPRISETAIAYINEHFAENITIDDLAHFTGISRYHFIRIFRKETGFTPHEYLVSTRINTAKYLLKNSNLTTKDICFRTDFSCDSVFCYAFKKHLNITPMEYRKRE